METFGKAFLEGRGTSATVARVRRAALVVAVFCLLALGGLCSSLLAAPAAPPSATSTTSTVSTSTVSTSTVTTSASPSVVVVSGHGWGHGLGLSQWGAYGYAKHGWTFDRILAHYYSGTTLGPAKLSTVRVLLASAKQTTLESPAAWTVVDAAGAKVALDPGPLVLAPKLSIPGHPELQPPFTFSGKQPLLVGKSAYRGRMSVSSDGKLVQVIDKLSLESYLKGVVPSEMPSSWSPEALKAQAVAARSYALANVTTGRAFDLYGDTRSQVFGGVAAESAAASAAVDATKGQVVLYKGKVANTLFFSTSGGRTASAAESTGLAVPYLVPVADPYDSASPYHDWGPLLFDAAAVAKKLKLASPIADLQTLTGPSGRAKSLTVVSDDASQVTLTGNQVRDALQLRSTWFTPALLQLLPATRTMTYGGAVSLSGRVRGADAVSLEAKPFGLDWAPAGDLLPDATGAFSTIVRPQTGTQYRLVWNNVRAGLAKIAVAVRVDATIQQGNATGFVRPAVANAPVELQWSTDGTTAWQTVATSTTDTSGAFAVSTPSPDAGSYRVRVAPGHGLSAGLSKSPCC
ncbi:MAG: stage sporulation protein [Gaiellaceae bacterium]|jgi:stage II sporulation protein D|nr:stage sporulation protein [Gaiellaceae bacterium]